ncbi:MAG: hypothetical protein V7608_2063 [Hyphomicrobiales bacterium]
MIARVLIAAACLVPHAALAAQNAQVPQNATEFARLPALGRLVESGVEKDTRFRTYLVGKTPSSTGAIAIFIGQIHMRVQDISGGTQRRPMIRKWSYAARCSGDANTIGVHTQSIAPREKAQTYFSVMPGVQPDAADLTWYNVWYAVCLDELNKYPRTQEE